ncbi:MAG: leucine-rich repeat domain-containing protein [Bacteroidaceae bacterium]|nr:leucine-rich repeat domain-containing protein [Bacteroidaceae bacterium]
MNGKTTALAMLIGLSANGFAQKGITRETFLQPKEVSIESSKELMNITIKGREGEPDFHYNRSVVLAQDEPIITRERHTNLDFVIPFSQSGTEEKSKEGNPVFFADGFKCEILTDSTVSISRMPVAYLTDAVTDSVFHIPAFVEYDGKTYQVREIAERGFTGNNNIKHLVIDEGIKAINSWAFICCYNLESVRIPASLSFIDHDIFGGCHNLKSIVVNPANKVFDSRDNCNAIIKTEFNILVAGCGGSSIPSSVTTIGEAAFANCRFLESITIPEGVTQIRESAFSGCIELKSISLPQSLEDIEDGAFGGCESLQSIVIPKNVGFIGKCLFRYCNQLVSITVEKGNKRYDSRQNCNAIIETESNKLVVTCAGTRLIEGIEEIGREAFYGVPLYELHIPKSVTSAEQWAFSGCDNLKSITVDEDNPAYTSPAGSNVLLTKDGKTLIKGCPTSVIPQGITTIGEGAFSGVNFTNSCLYLPEGLKIIGHQAFYGCTNLYQVIVPSSVEYIRENAFASCPDLNIALLKGGGKSLGPYAFAGCKRLGIIQLPEGMTTIKDGAFRGCTNLYGIGLPSSLQEVGRNAFKDCPCEEEVLQLVQKNKK